MRTMRPSNLRVSATHYASRMAKICDSNQVQEPNSNTKSQVGISRGNPLYGSICRHLGAMTPLPCDGEIQRQQRPTTQPMERHGTAILGCITSTRRNGQPLLIPDHTKIMTILSLVMSPKRVGRHGTLIITCRLAFHGEGAQHMLNEPRTFMA